MNKSSVKYELDSRIIVVHPQVDDNQWIGFSLKLKWIFLWMAVVVSANLKSIDDDTIVAS